MRRKPDHTTLDRFCDLIADHNLATGDRGGDCQRAAERLGFPREYGNSLLQKIRKRLGPQAR